MLLGDVTVPSLTVLQTPLPRLKRLLSILMAGSPASEGKKLQEKERMKDASSPDTSSRKSCLSGSQMSTQGKGLKLGWGEQACLGAVFA